MPTPGRARKSLAVATMTMIGFVGCAKEEPPPELPPRSILWERVSEGAGGQLRVISGIVTAVDDTTLAFEVGGIVDRVPVNLGDLVAKNDVLANLDPEPFELKVSDAQAELSKAIARRASASADFERTTKLFEADVSSRQELDRDRARRDSLEGQVDAAEARLNLAKRDLRRSVLRAPFNGAISVKEIEPAMKVGSGQVVIEMDSAEGGLRVEVQMPETLMSLVRQGGEAEVQFPSSTGPNGSSDDRTYSAIVTEVGTRARAGNAFPVRADLLESPNWLRPGMTAEVRFEVDRQVDGVAGFEGFLLPLAAAVIEADGSFSVFVYDSKTSTVSKRAIRTGGVRDNDIAILEGLEPGEIVATAGVSFLREGQEVALLSEHLVQTAP
jgi:multidrug efflux system membrane fusion protein